MTVEARFALGRLVQTPGAQAAAAPAHVLACVHRHVTGDWGVIDAHDAQVNEAALRDGGSILSAYPIDVRDPGKGMLWVITDADRSATTVLLPEEY
jgi:hypothetical protein